MRIFQTVIKEVFNQVQDILYNRNVRVNKKESFINIQVLLNVLNVVLICIELVR